MIINPWIFYAIDVLVSLEDFLFTMILIILALFVGAFLGAIYEKSEESETYIKCISWIKKLVIAFFICTSIVIAIPTRETMYTMLVSSYVTTDNIETVSDVIQDSVDYIFEKLNNEGE